MNPIYLGLQRHILGLQVRLCVATTMLRLHVGSRAGQLQLELYVWALLNLLKILHGALGLYESAIDESETFFEVEAWIRSLDSRDS